MDEPDYFVVAAGDWEWPVSLLMVKAIEADLDGSPTPRWITFVDLAGSRVRVATGALESITQSTPEMRATRRALREALEKERGE